MSPQKTTDPNGRISPFGKRGSKNDRPEWTHLTISQARLKKRQTRMDASHHLANAAQKTTDPNGRISPFGKRGSKNDRPEWTHLTIWQTRLKKRQTRMDASHHLANAAQKTTDPNGRISPFGKRGSKNDRPEWTHLTSLVANPQPASGKAAVRGCDNLSLPQWSEKVRNCSPLKWSAQKANKVQELRKCV